MTEESALEPPTAGRDQQVGPVAPAFEEAAEVLAAELVPLVVVQLGPLAVFVAHQWEGRVRHHPVALVLELETVVDVEVSIEPEHLAHQAHGIHGIAAECHHVCLHSVGVAGVHFLVEVLQVIGSEAVGPEHPDRRVAQLGRDRAQHVSNYLGGPVDDDDVLTKALLDSDVLAGGVPDYVVAMDDPDVRVLQLHLLPEVRRCRRWSRCL